MSDYAVAEFFREESLLEISLGQDGLLGFFANNFPTIMEMARAIYFQEEETLERKSNSYEELIDLRESLKHLDSIISSKKSLSDLQQAKYNQLKLDIEFEESELEREDPIFFKGKSLKMCAEYEFIDKCETNFPGLMFAMTEFDQMLRHGIGGFVSKHLSWVSMPLRMIVGLIIQHSNAGIAGNLIYLLVDQYPEIIRQRIEAPKPEEAPADYSELDEYSIKDIKHETKIKYNNSKDDDE